MRLTHIRFVPLSTVILSWYFCLDEVLNFNVLASEIPAGCRIHFAVASLWYYYFKQLASVLYGIEIFAGSQFTSFPTVINGESVMIVHRSTTLILFNRYLFPKKKNIANYSSLVKNFQLFLDQMIICLKPLQIVRLSMDFVMLRLHCYKNLLVTYSYYKTII